MYVDRPAKVGVGIGFLGVLIGLLGTIFIILLPQELMDAETAGEYMDTWVPLIIFVGEGLQVYGILLLSAIGAYYLTRQGYSPRELAVGFGVGTLFFTISSAILGATTIYLFARDPNITIQSPVITFLTFGVRIGIGAAIGVLCVFVVDYLFEE